MFAWSWLTFHQKYSSFHLSQFLTVIYNLLIFTIGCIINDIFNDTVSKQPRNHVAMTWQHPEPKALWR